MNREIPESGLKDFRREAFHQHFKETSHASAISSANSPKYFASWRVRLCSKRSKDITISDKLGQDFSQVETGHYLLTEKDISHHQFLDRNIATKIKANKPKESPTSLATGHSVCSA